MSTRSGTVHPDRVKFLRTVRIIRRQVKDPAAFPPERRDATLAQVMAAITDKRNLNAERRDRDYPRVVKRGRHNHYPVKTANDTGTRHDGPPTIRIAKVTRPAALINSS